MVERLGALGLEEEHEGDDAEGQREGRRPQARDEDVVQRRLQRVETQVRGGPQGNAAGLRRGLDGPTSRESPREPRGSEASRFLARAA